MFVLFQVLPEYICFAYCICPELYYAIYIYLGWMMREQVTNFQKVSIPSFFTLPGDPILSCYAVFILKSIRVDLTSVYFFISTFT